MLTFFPGADVSCGHFPEFIPISCVKFALLYAGWLIDRFRNWFYFLFMLFNWFPPPRQQNKSENYLLYSSCYLFTWLQGLLRFHQLNACIWTASWIHESHIFFRWQHQDHQHHQTASWNIKHFVILDFKAQLQLSEWLQRQPPCQGGLLFRRAVFQKLKFILVTYRLVWGKKGDTVFIVQLCRAGPISWGACCSKHTKKAAAHTAIWESTTWSLCKTGSIH